MPHNKYPDTDSSALHFSSDPNPDVYTDEEALRDLTGLVAAATSGVKGAIPESEDQDFAAKILEMINTRFDEPDEYKENH